MSFLNKLKNATADARQAEKAKRNGQAASRTEARAEIDRWLTPNRISKGVSYVHELALVEARQGKNSLRFEVRAALAQCAEPGRFPAVGNLAESFHYYPGYDGSPDFVSCPWYNGGPPGPYQQANNYLWHRFRDELLDALAGEFDEARPLYTDIEVRW